MGGINLNSDKVERTKQDKSAIQNLINTIEN